MRASPCQGCQSLSCSNFIRRRYLPQAYISCIDWVQLFRVLPKELFLVTCVSWTHLIQCLSSLVLFLVYFVYSFSHFFSTYFFFFFFLPILGRFFPPFPSCLVKQHCQISQYQCSYGVGFFLCSFPFYLGSTQSCCLVLLVYMGSLVLQRATLAVSTLDIRLIYRHPRQGS